MTTPGGSPFYRLDLIVLLGGAALVAIGLVAQGTTGAATAYTSFERDGLTVPYPQSAKWFAPTGDGYPAIIGSAQCSSDPRVACADQPTAQITVRVYDDAMGLGAAQAGKDHDAAYGNRARRIIGPEAPRDIADKTWACMRFAYVPVGAKSESAAIECAVAHHKKLYVVTLAGPEAYVTTLEPGVINHLIVK